MRVLLVGLVVAMGCRGLLEPFGAAEPTVRGSIEMPPRPEFQALWDQVTQCSGIDRPMPSVRFYRVPENQLMVDGDRVAGYFQPEANRITLEDMWTLDTFGQRNPVYRDNIIRHEMLHAHLRGILRGHPTMYFVEKCGALVGPHD